MLKKFASRRAESLVEVIVAITIIVMTSSSAMLLLTTAIKTNAATRNRIVATSLAREAVEMTENIVRTNIMRFQSFKDTCWNFLEVVNPSNPARNLCSDAKKAVHTEHIGGAPSPGKVSVYIPEMDLDTYKWYLREESGNRTDEKFRLYRTKAAPNQPALYIAKPSAVTTEEETPFFRHVSIVYKSFDGTTIKAAPPKGKPGSTPFYEYNFMEITGEVVWVESGEELTVTFVQMFSL